MKSFVQFVVFQAVWFAAVWGASRGNMWLGPAAAAVFLFAQVAFLYGWAERRRELLYVAAVGTLGTLADTLLWRLGATAYPTSADAWPLPLVPPWIVSLWVAFALLPRFSLAWLKGRPAVAALLGAIGGPLSYLAGERLGAVATGRSTAFTASCLAIEYAVAMPLLLRLAPRTGEPRG